MKSIDNIKNIANYFQRIKKVIIFIVFAIILIGNTKNISAEGNYYWPTPAVIDLSRGYTTSPIVHKAIDIAAPEGTDIYATKSGTVIGVGNACNCIGNYPDCSHKFYAGSGYETGVGTGVMIKHDDGSGYSIYAHMTASSWPENVYEGAHVNQGQFIGKTGNSGNSKGPHLHFVLMDNSATNWWNCTKINNNKDQISYVYDYSEVEISDNTRVMDAGLFTSLYIDQLTDTSVKIGAEYAKDTFNDVGFYFGTVNDINQMTKVSENKYGNVSFPQTSYGNSYKLGVWYDDTYGYKWWNPLTAGTKYYWAFYLQQGNTEYISTINSFTTTGDSVSPVIESIKVTDLSSKGYTIEVVATDNVGIAKVCCPTWTLANEQDDLIQNWENNTVATHVSGNTYTYRVNTSEHNNESGSYVTHVYAYDMSGNFVISELLKEVPKPTISVTSVSLNNRNLSLEVDGTSTLTATVSPSNATNKAVTWTSSNTSVATVTNGAVKAVAPGTATITVKTADGNKAATCAVTVKAKTVSVSSVALNKTSVSLTVDETETLTATVSPSNATNKTVTWTSSNTGVATVTNGTIKAIAPGTATITVTTVDGSKTATCTVSTFVAKGSCGDDIEWNLSVDGTLTLTGTGETWSYGYPDSSGSEQLPFIDYDITKVIVGEGITHINSNIFSGCSEMESISLPDSLLYLRETFTGCDSLVTLEIPKNVYSLSTPNAPNLKEINVHKSNSTFSSIDGILYMGKTLVRVPAGVEGVFHVDPTTESVNGSAFNYCKNLTEICFTAACLDETGPLALVECENLKAFSVSGSSKDANVKYHVLDGLLYKTYSGMKCESGAQEEIWVMRCPPGLSEVSVKSVYGVEEKAFSYCEKLKIIDLPEGIICMGDGAFQCCRSLESIKVPQTVTCIPDGMFGGCTSLVEIEFGANIMEIGDGAFLGCESLNDVYYGGSLEQWKKITIESYNESLQNANIHYAAVNPNAPKLVVSNAKGTAGDTVTVMVDLENNPGFAGLNAYLTYSDDLTLVEATNIITDFTFTNEATMVWDAASDYSKDGELLKLTFLISEDAESGDHFVKINFIESYTKELEGVTFVTVDGYIEVIDSVYGDANGDNEINTRDIILVRRHIASRNPITGESSVEVNTGADTNGDGAVNTKDIILLRRYVASRDPITGESSVILGPNK